MATQNYVLLERIELTQSAASVTFSNIPQSGYTDLKIVASTRSANAGAIDAIYARFNSSSTGYTNKVLYGETTGAGSFSPSISYAHSGYGVGGNGTANTFSNTEIYIPNYTSSNYKPTSVDSVTETNAGTTQSGVQSLEAALWSNTAAITSITFTQESGSNFVAGCTFSIYGLAAVGTTPTIAPKALGGNIQTDGTYWYHTFLASGTFTTQTSLSCDYLVVAGGGGSGAGHTGGGAGGGLRSTVTATGGGGTLESRIALTANTSYTVTVGAGGAGGPSTGTTTAKNGTIGGNSTFASITSIGGGFSATSDGGSQTSGNGGSGGGSSNNGAAGSGTANQGYNGGATTGANLPGAGGGGAGGAGSPNNGSTSGGNGGAGVAISAFATVTGTGVSNYYAGGGGGGALSANYPSSTGGNGGAGGGANGNASGNGGTNASANTGGGAGGSNYSSGYGTGGNGGSGLVIIRYAV